MDESRSAGNRRSHMKGRRIAAVERKRSRKTFVGNINKFPPDFLPINQSKKLMPYAAVARRNPAHTRRRARKRRLMKDR